MQESNITLRLFLIVLIWFSPGLAARPIDLSELPGTVTSVVFFDYLAEQNSESLQAFQNQIIKATGWEKELEQLVLLDGNRSLYRGKPVSTREVLFKKGAARDSGTLAWRLFQEDPTGSETESSN